MKRHQREKSPNILPSLIAPPDWRSKASELLPELHTGLLLGDDAIAEAENPMALWHDINYLFRHAYEEPQNDDLIRRVYAFADWSVKQMRKRQLGPDDLSTAAVVCFYEHLPTSPAARADMPRWFTRSQIMESDLVFRYFLDEREWQELLALWSPRPRHPAKPKKRSR